VKNTKCYPAVIIGRFYETTGVTESMASTSDMLQKKPGAVEDDSNSLQNPVQIKPFQFPFGLLSYEAKTTVRYVKECLVLSFEDDK